MRGNFGDKGDILKRGQAGDKVVELEDETNMVAAIACQRLIAEGRDVLPVKDHGPG